MTAVVLAAGFSRRFGSAKQLFTYFDEPLVRRAARVAREVAPVIVVIPKDAGIRQALEGLDVTIVENEERAEGMASSIRAGVRACDGDVLLTLCDQPTVDSAHLRKLIDSHAPIAASGYDGTVGVPALFRSTYRDALLALQGDTGAKSLLLANKVHVVELADGSDIDRSPRSSDLGPRIG
ncbi:MAG TPA: nucleotidyltransferase family protein [Thermoanaerobaculia bacterium]|nr:nucleotidyltransferase family protein [Thermoanaerobaculia bacterium]